MRWFGNFGALDGISGRQNTTCLSRHAWEFKDVEETREQLWSWEKVSKS